MANLSAAEIGKAAYTAGFRGRDLVIAIAVAFAESSGNPVATNKNNNGSTDYGLWQINSIHAAILKQGSWQNPVDNARMAKRVFDEAGGRWTPWVTYKTGAYLKYMPNAARAVAAGFGNMSDKPDFTNVDLSKVPGVEGDIAGIVSFFKFIADTNNWRRVGLFAAGLVLIVIAFFRLTGDNKMSGATKTAIALAITKKPKGKVK